MRDYSTKVVKAQQLRPSEVYPELVDALAKTAILTEQLTTPKLAKLLGISKQALQQRKTKLKKEALCG